MPFVKISGSGMNAFSVISQASLIEPKQYSTFAIRFMPNFGQIYSAIVTIFNNDYDENPYTFTIIGTGVAAQEINVKQGTTDISSTTGSYDFGDVGIGSQNTDVTFTIENLGDADLILSVNPKIEISGNDAAMFIIDQTSTISPVNQQSSTTFTITFSPTSTGKKSATISIPNNDSDENPYTFTITGNGTSSGTIYCWTKRLGGTHLDTGYSVTTDSFGNVYSTGYFYGTVNFGDDFGVSDFKTATGCYDIFVTKIKSNGTYCWTKRIGGTCSDGGFSATCDSLGNIYITGLFWGTADFGADFLVSDSKTSEGNWEVFITKINANGTYGWTRRIGGPSDDRAYSVKIGLFGDVFLFGLFQGTVDFGADFSTSDIKTSLGCFDLFITKINSNGTYGWTKRIGGIGDDIAWFMTTDISGNVYLTGWFCGTINFGADFNVNDIKTAASSDIFITKINSNGTYGWTKRIGGASCDFGCSITTDSLGNVYLTGGFYGTVNFGEDFSATDIKTSAGSCDIFITKINANGDYGWTKRMGGICYEYGYSIATDTSDNVYVVGRFYGTIDFGSDFNISDNKTSVGSCDIFITKINANGTYSWTKRMGGLDIDDSYSITGDNAGNVYLTGRFNGTVDFGADFGVSDSKTSAGSSDIFITKLSQ